MQYIKTFESFDIGKYMDEINKYQMIEIDPFDEEDWDELEEGDIIYYVDDFMNINFEKYDGTQDMLLKFNKLTRNSLLKSLIKIRNRQITRSKLKSEKIFRSIYDKKRELEEKLEIIYKKGEVEDSDRDVTIEDIKNGKVGKFTFYNFIKEGGHAVDKYYASVIGLKESKRDDFFLGDWWDEVEKYKDDIGLNIEQKTFNIAIDAGGVESLGSNIYLPQLEFLVEEGDIILESKNVKSQIFDEYKNVIDIETKKLMGDLESIKDELKLVDGFVERKVVQVEKRFPTLKK